jgi:hypothetical protein
MEGGEMSEKLLPCAHCGGEANFWEAIQDEYWCGILCTSCGVEMKHESKSDVISAWNHRSTRAPTNDAIRSAVKLNSTPDRHCTVFKGTEITGYTLTDEGITELRKLFCGVPVGVTREFIETALRDYRLRNFVDEDNEPLALNDRLTNGPTVKEGNEEIHELADFIACRIADLSLRGEPEDWVNLAQMVADGNFNQADVIALARKLASQPGGE